MESIIDLADLKTGLNSPDIEEMMTLDGSHLTSEAYEYAVNHIGIDTMDIMYYPNTDSWGY